MTLMQCNAQIRCAEKTSLSCTILFVRSGFRSKVQLLNCTHAAMNAYSVGTVYTAQGAFHVANPEDIRCEIELLLAVAAYNLLPWRGGATLFCFMA